MSMLNFVPNSTKNLQELACFLYGHKKDNLFLLKFLFIFITDINNLQNVVICTQLKCPNVKLDVLFQEILGQFSHILWPSGTPHKGLSVRLKL